MYAHKLELKLLVRQQKRCLPTGYSPHRLPFSGTFVPVAGHQTLPYTLLGISNPTTAWSWSCPSTSERLQCVLHTQQVGHRCGNQSVTYRVSRVRWLLQRLCRCRGWGNERSNRSRRLRRTCRECSCTWSSCRWPSRREHPETTRCDPMHHPISCQHRCTVNSSSKYCKCFYCYYYYYFRLTSLFYRRLADGDVHCAGSRVGGLV